MRKKLKVRVGMVILAIAVIAFILRLRSPSGEFVPVEYNSAVARFRNTIKTEWIRATDPEASRQFRLLEPVEYIASDQSIWQAKAGSIIDGASIPRAFWTIVGAPTTGPYRDASVIHDVYCDSKERSWEETHWVFRDACRAAGLGPWQANLLYLAVFHYGPIWTDDGILQQETVQVDDETATRMAEFCQENPDLSIDELHKLDPKIWEDS
ncbi:DUF1353 domain-containing protein [Picosynechococcus sp. PCC 8807]|uniref:DUF1353 domain-containing protein n=1 Tax=Picosynechococcus sp. PCC 8807 TaxID=195248 RepID=UPI0009FD3FFA|nr:DUF1353 domain-containing protein [Picosynechococcus sp. PCC 8807]